MRGLRGRRQAARRAESGRLRHSPNLVTTGDNHVTDCRRSSEGVAHFTGTTPN
jgi:hypothetical protein